MSLMKIIKFICLSLLAVNLGFFSLPPLSVNGDITQPEEFYGDITLNGNPAPSGTAIVARINGVERGSLTTTVTGEYGGSGTFDTRLVVSGEESEKNDEITFWVGDSRADQTAIYEPGLSKNLDLSVQGYPLNESDVQIVKALDYLRGQQQSDGSISAFLTSAWAVMAIASVGEDPNDWDAGGDSIVEYLSNNSNHLDPDKATDWERAILAIVAAGKNPRDFGGIDYVGTLLDFYDGSQIGSSGQLNDDCWGLIAMEAIGEGDLVENSKSFIINNQNADGGWNWTVGGDSTADDTAAAISALIAAGESPSSSVITDALDFLKSQQQTNGGFTSEGTTNTGVDTWVITAIADTGQSPVADEWRKSGNNPIGHLLDLQHASGFFYYTTGVESNPEWMTAYALISLMGNSWPEDNTAPVISGLSPSSGGSTDDTSPAISASLTDATSAIDTSSVFIKLDGTNVSSASTITSPDVTSATISYTPSGLSTGTHTVQVGVSDKRGNQASKSWSFYVTDDDENSSGGGGSGGGGTAGVISLSGVTSNSGKITEDVSGESEDGKIELTIFEDTVCKNRVGSRLSSITIEEMDNPPSAPSHTEIVGLVYDLSPDGATFDPEIEITLHYSSSQVPDGVDEEDLVLAYWDEDDDEWVELSCTVDPGDNTITALVDHFSAFTIIAHNRPADFSLSNLSIRPAEIKVGESTTVTVIVSNDGDLTEDYEVIVTLNNTVAATKEVSVAGDDSERVSLTIIGAAPGKYTLSVGSLSGVLIVTGEAVPPEETEGSSEGQVAQIPPTPPLPGASTQEITPPQPSDSGPPLPPGPSPESTNWLLFAGIGGGVIIIGLLIFLVARRRSF